MKRVLLVILSLLLVFSLASCNNTPTGTTEPTQATEATSSTIPPVSSTTADDVVTPVGYETKAVNIYREKNVVDKTIDVRFYETTPHVPFISVADYYTEFFKIDLEVDKNASVYTYTNADGGYLKFDAQENEISIYDIYTFSNHPDFQESVSKTYLVDLGPSTTPVKEKIIDLDTYFVDVYGDEDGAYVPLALLSSFSGVLDGYAIAYNGNDIFVLDERPQLSDKTHNVSYFGKSYTSTLSDLKTPRYEDMAKVNYGMLCFMFDNLRGYTTQLIFGDNNLVSLGLDGLLEKYYPKAKQYLLSTDKYEYLIGINFVLAGMYDGGHTAVDSGVSLLSVRAQQEVANDEDFGAIYAEYTACSLAKISIKNGIKQAKAIAFAGYRPNVGKVNLYVFDAASKTAFICFDRFEVDYDGWDNYYNNGMKAIDIPDDTFAFIRESFYKALQDGAENVVIDVSTNGGGDTTALCGIVGLVNKGKCDFELNDIVGKARITESYGIDINLDGEFDEKDVAEAEKFTFNIGVLTSAGSFSCGNLLPSVLKELGCKIIGQKSGGGSCAVCYGTTADGFSMYYSSFMCLSNASGDNIDGGVELDYEIESKADLYNFNVIAAYFASLKK